MNGACPRLNGAVDFFRLRTRDAAELSPAIQTKETIPKVMPILVFQMRANYQEANPGGNFLIQLYDCPKPYAHRLLAST
jgi:hypothetical protein